LKFALSTFLHGNFLKNFGVLSDDHGVPFIVIYLAKREFKRESGFHRL